MGKPFHRERLNSIFRAVSHAEAPNKRCHPRVPCRMEVECKCGRTQFAAGTVNISEGGALLRPSNGLCPGRRLKARFELPHRMLSVTPGCRVVRTEPANQTSVEFVGLRPGQRRAIREFVARCS
jgi:c-di-GMP-binding flagellar brake protein YcgR